MKQKEIKALATDKLQAEVLKQRQEQMNLRFQAATGQLAKTHQVKNLRRTVARLKTEQAARRGAAKKGS